MDSLHAEELELHAMSKRGLSYPIPLVEIVFEMPPPAVTLRVKGIHGNNSSIRSSFRSPLSLFSFNEDSSDDDDSLVSCATMDTVDSLVCTKRRLHRRL